MLCIGALRGIDKTCAHSAVELLPTLRGDQVLRIYLLIPKTHIIVVTFRFDRDDGRRGFC